LKHVHISEEAHSEVRQYCEETNKKQKGTIDLIVIEGVKAMRKKELPNKEGV
jgi:hypothetical protein